MHSSNSGSNVNVIHRTGPLNWGRARPILDLPSQDPVLRRQIFVSQQEFLIDYSRDIGEQARPKHFKTSLNLTVERGLYTLLRFQNQLCRKIARPETKPFQCV